MPQACVLPSSCALSIIEQCGQGTLMHTMCDICNLARVWFIGCYVARRSYVRMRGQKNCMVLLTFTCMQVDFCG